MIVRIPATSANLGPGFDSLGLALALYNDFQVKPSILQSIKIKGEGEGIPKLIKDNNFIKIFKETCESIESGDLAQNAPKKATNQPKNLGANPLNLKFANPKDSPKPYESKVCKSKNHKSKRFTQTSKGKFLAKKF